MKRRRLSRIYDCRVDAALGGIRRAVTAGLGIAIILMTLLAPQLASSRSNLDMALPGLVDGRMLICTGTGMMVVDVDGHPVGDEHGQTHTSVFCLPFLKGTVAAPAAFELTTGTRIVFDQAPTAPIADIPPRPVLDADGISPRGPPPLA